MTRKVAPEAGADGAATAMDMALASLGLAMPPVEPPASLWPRIEAGLSAADPIPLAALDVERFQSGAWRAIAPGVRVKRLWGKRTLLFDCDPGAVVPAHRHRTYEHSLILSGDVTSEDGDFTAGDYTGMAAGSMHGAWSTRTGCRVLIQYDT